MGLADTVDIVVLNCNNNGVIKRCIDSIKNNTDDSYNLIVVDQNSKDGSREWLRDSKAVSHLILNGKNAGIARGRNQGIKVGRCPWIIFIDSDIEIKDPMWLDKVWNYTIDNRVGMIEVRMKERDWEKGKWQFSKTHFCLIRRQCLNEVGHFDKRFIVAPDMDWLARLEWSWWKTAYCYDTDIFHLAGATKLTGCMEDVFHDLTKIETDLLNTKYTSVFLENTLNVNSKRRYEKEKVLLK